MRFVFLLLLFILTLPVNAMSLVSDAKCSAKWGIPVEREDGTELLLEDIAYYTLYLDGIKYKEFTNSVTKAGWWQFSDCPTCIQATTTDTDERTSIKSECF